MAEENHNIPEITPEEEAKLARMASRRTGFKKHFAIFFLLNAFLWVVWYFLFRDSAENTFLMATQWHPERTVLHDSFSLRFFEALAKHAGAAI